MMKMCFYINVRFALYKYEYEYEYEWLYLQMQFILGQNWNSIQYFNTYTVDGFRDKMNTREQGSVP